MVVVVVVVVVPCCGCACFLLAACCMRGCAWRLRAVRLPGAPSLPPAALRATRPIPHSLVKAYCLTCPRCCHPLQSLPSSARQEIQPHLEGMQAAAQRLGEVSSTLAKDQK